jgi:chitodextrinase
MNTHDITALMAGIAPILKDEIEALQKQIAALSARIAELESGAMKYCGVHQASMVYCKGNVVTHDGSAWCATRSVNAERPGTSDAWQLMVKHGKDAVASSSPRSDATATSNERRNGHYANPRRA